MSPDSSEAAAPGAACSPRAAAPAAARAPCPPGSARLLAEVAAGVSTGSDVEALLRQLLDPLVRLAGAHAGTVRVLGEDDQLHLVSSVDLRAPASPGAGGGTCTTAAVARQCGHCGQALADARVVWAHDGSACRHRDERAGAPMLSVPLPHREQVLGVYNLYFGAALPGGEVQDLLLAVGKLLGLALAKERLEAETLRAALLHERQMLAAEVHDSIAQSLSFVKMRLPLLRDAIEAGQGGTAARYFDDVRSGVGQAHASLRSVLTEFRAPMDARGLLPALRACADVFRHRSGTELTLQAELSEAALAALLDEQRESQVFHIVQEALNNIERHAGAQHAWLTLAQGAQGDVLDVCIEDDGSGLRHAAGTGGDATAAGMVGSPSGSHYGMAIMVERARRIGASLAIGPRRGGGTTVSLHVPRPGPATAALPARSPA
jgi:two-component system nitrate/nitrite sensor histidine kinase NarX